MSDYNNDENLSPSNNDQQSSQTNDQKEHTQDAKNQESYIPPTQTTDYKRFENATSNHTQRDYSNYEKPRKQVNSGLIVLIVLIAVAGITAITGMIIGNNPINPLASITPNVLKNIPFIGGNTTQSPVRTKVSPIAKDFIAVIKIEGVIENKNKTYDQKLLLSTVKGLVDDKRNKGILLVIESPGGGVYQSDEMYNELMMYKKKTDRPIWAYITSLGASGGYYIACAADTIIANRNALLGSIGVISGASIDLSELMENYGIKMTTFTSGKNKNMLNVNSPITEEQHQIMQSIADEAYIQFTEIVAESRRLPLEKVKILADGRIYTANQGKKNHLVDDVLFYDQTVEKMKTELELKSDIEMRDYSTRSSPNFYDFFVGQESVFKVRTNDLPSAITQQLQKQPPYPAYYYFH
ncbi:MAG: signal peptide peptidase SppA [Treponemataceae bacterium]